MEVQEKYLIVKNITIIKGNEIEDRIVPVEEYPYTLTKEEAIEVLKQNPGIYLAVAVLSVY